MDGSPSVAAAGRRIVSWAWVVKLEPDKTTAATGVGPVVQKTLGPGQYTITLQVGGGLRAGDEARPGHQVEAEGGDSGAPVWRVAQTEA